MRQRIDASFEAAYPSLPGLLHQIAGRTEINDSSVGIRVVLTFAVYCQRM